MVRFKPQTYPRDLINKIQGNMEQSCTNKYPRRVKFGWQSMAEETRKITCITFL